MSNQAQVLVFRGTKSTYTYKIPEINTQEYAVGDHVHVPFGTSETSGLIINIGNPKTKEKKFRIPLKTILGKVEKKPRLQQDLIDLIEWFTHHYHLTPFKAYQTIIGNKNIRKLDDQESPLQPSKPDYPLTNEQQEALSVMQKSPNEFLLHGVTASGKTEVYMQLAEKNIQNNKNVLLLLPEIALTPQFTRVFHQRFGDNISVIHSGLTPKQREIEWNRIHIGNVQIVIGPRSAIFAPLSKIGLIILDEEHDSSYKQENHPRYYTHTVAKFRAQQHKAKLIFGSATPTIEQYYQHLQPTQQTLIKMKKRARNIALPNVKIIDLTQVWENKEPHLITRPLQERITQRLEKKEKVMLLLNRRGFAPYVMCQACGKPHTCSQCQLSYTYHKDKTFRCHRCFRIEKLTHCCSHCKKNRLAFTGIGIQKLETELKRFFPEAIINRLDRDTAKNITQCDQILEDFKKNGDILIGTQLISKGHDIQTVTLVGVLGIDTTLNIPDFRSPERTFQLLTQVAGRAGRGDKLGEVLIQTSHPDHYAITHASKHNFEGFYEEEISFRQELWYPPFSSLINLIFSSKSTGSVKTYTQRVSSYLEKNTSSFQEKLQIHPPKPAPIEMIQGHYRYNILIKYQKSIEDKIKSIVYDLPKTKRDIRTFIDSEPQSIL